MKRIALILLASISLGLSASVLAAGGGGMSAPAPVAPQKSPDQLAVENYNRGLKYRDRAWEFEEKMAAESDGRKKGKLAKKVAKNYKNAAKRFKAALKYNDRLFQAHGSLGYALRKLGDYDAALVAYNTSLKLNPRYEEAIEYRGETYLALGQLEATREAYMQLSQLGSKQAAVLMAAIQTWLQNPPSSIPATDVEAMREWANERLALSAFVGDDAVAPDWSVH